MSKGIALFLFTLFSCSAFAEMVHCRFEPIGVPMTYMQYDTNRHVAWVTYGWPQRTVAYTRIKELSNSPYPPYFASGLTLTTKNGTPIIHIKRTGAGTVWYERNTYYNWEAAWGAVPGRPLRQPTRGVCWTGSVPPVTYGNNGSY